ncbi:glycosyltransferase [Mesorhizobium sp. BR1-1-9]|uniref:glycosyltransferase n=1 Tax=unclassified Mesorhizobium TaxID=325217 RepID=UPI001CD0ED8A|nr:MULTISPECIES: glycosyltransferase [unclassified Mesorhizobium]MBZ9869796.1 glycosyltransferase [Mesorhizobium sp. BR1-1-9]MBZ9940477.1 glycosyltransferase [Mesorhizobium sp. BR1-1-13]
MAVKKYGIFLAYPPTVNLRTEGLGRYLSAFVKAASTSQDRHLVIATPSWLRIQLSDLFKDAEVPEASYSFVGPVKLPLLLRMYLRAKRSPKPRRGPRFRRLLRYSYLVVAGHLKWLTYGIASTRNPLIFVALCSYFGVISLVSLPIAALFGLFKSAKVTRIVSLKIERKLYAQFGEQILRVRQIVTGTRKRLPASSVGSFFFAGMHYSEMRQMVSEINRTRPASAWYCPTAFWPQFNELEAARLMCVPDIVVSDFAIDFAEYGEPVVITFDDIGSAIAGGSDFVTYSQHIKTDTLVHQMGVDPERVWVVPHAPSTLSHRTDITGFPNNEAASKSLSQALVVQSLHKVTGLSRAVFLSKTNFKFLFYASQFRPSKNVITLLRAYEHLLRKRFIGHKLVLTGNGDAKNVREFIERYDLADDVLCLYGLTEVELASFYKCADLAVNPSLSEGGMPFTFTEALSVGTPVVMADIDVTREILTDPALRQATLFNPYDWRNMADKIEWALKNRDTLYLQQRQFFDVLAKRTWEDVVNEHIGILDAIAERNDMTKSS